MIIVRKIFLSFIIMTTSYLKKKTLNRLISERQEVDKQKEKEIEIKILIILPEYLLTHQH